MEKCIKNNCEQWDGALEDCIYAGKANLEACGGYLKADKEPVADVRCNDGLELERLNEENNVLWAILHTCVHCKKAVRGVVYGCEIQKHIDLTGICNQREEF